MESDAAPPMKMCLLVNLNRKISHKVYPATIDLIIIIIKFIIIKSMPATHHPKYRGLLSQQ